MSSALLFGQLAKLNKIQNLREKIWNKYNENFSKLSNKNVYFLKNKHKFKKSAYHVFALIFKNIKLRDKFILFMKKKGIDCYFHYYPLHISSFGKKFSRSEMNNTNKIYNGLVRLPLYPGLKNQR